MRSDPQAIPYSPLLMKILLALYFFIGVVVLMEREQLDRAIGIQVLDILLLLGYFSLCLRLMNMSPRFVQTMSAMLGVGCLFQLSMWPLAMYHGDKTDAAQSPALLSLIALMLLSWYLLVYAHILRSALNMHMASAIGLSVAYLFLSISLEQLIFQVY